MSVQKTVDNTSMVDLSCNNTYVILHCLIDTFTDAYSDGIQNSSAKKRQILSKLKYVFV